MGVFESIQYYFSVYKRYTGNRIYLIFALTATAALTEGLGIAMLLPLLEVAGIGEAATDSSAPAFLVSILEILGIENSLIGILVFIGVVFIGKGLLKFAEEGYASYLSAQLMKEIKGRMFDAYSRLDYQYYTSKNTGHFVNIINHQISNFIQSFQTFVKFLSKIIITIAYLSIAFLIAWNFALMAMVVGVILLFLFKKLNKIVHILSQKTAREHTELNKFLVQTMQSFKYISSTGQTRHLRTGIMNSIKRLASFMFKKGAAGAFTVSIKEPIAVIFLLSVIILQVLLFGAPVESLFVALVLFYRAMQHIISIQEDWQKTMNKIGSLEMVLNEFDIAEKNREPQGEIKIESLNRSIQFKDVHFAYEEAEADVLSGVNVSIPARQTIAFVGESGAGKSTLIDMLPILLKPDRGEILIDGHPATRIERSSWRSLIGYVSQETIVFDDTIANNISLWEGEFENDETVQQKVVEAAHRAHAAEFIESLPDGYLTKVGDRGVKLSGGQRQRLFVARELYKKPNLLILDEATSALDTESERYIQKSIDALKGTMTVVIIAHRLSTIRNADYIYLLSNGKVIEEGTYDQLHQKSKSKFRKMVNMQKL